MQITEYDKKMAKEIFNKIFSTPREKEDIFYELVFCLCAPQTTYKRNIRVLDYLRDHRYYYVPFKHDWLEEALKPVRFYRNKAKWVAEAKKKFTDIFNIVAFGVYNARTKRDWLLENVKGLGMKAASHFLRNLGARDLAIIDTHVLKFLEVTGKWKYEELENQLKNLAANEGLSIGEFDIILWQKYSKTDWSEYNH